MGMNLALMESFLFFSRLIDLFFKFFAGWGFRVVPALFWRDMYRALEPGAHPSTLRTAHYSPFLHNAVLSVSMAFSDDKQVRARSNRELLAKRAKDQIETECQKPVISTISGLSFLGSFHSGQNEHGLGYMYFGAFPFPSA